MTQVFLVTPTGSNQTFTSPSDWNNSANTIECIGAGGGGNAGQISNFKPTGGGGGAYSKLTNFSFATPGTTTATYQIGAHGAVVSGAAVGVSGSTAGNAGGNTWFDGTTFAGASVGAQGGQGAPVPGSGTAASNGGTRGLASNRPNSAGTTGVDGGDGGSIASGFSGTFARGGGGAGGPNGAGNAGANPGASTQFGNGGSGDAGSGGAGGTSAANNTETAGGAGTEFQASPARGSGGGGGGGNVSTNAAATGLGAGGQFGGGSGGFVNQGSGGNKSTLATTAVAGDGLIVITYTPIVPLPKGFSFALRASSFYPVNAPVSISGLYYQKPANVYGARLSANTGFYALTGEAATLSTTHVAFVPPYAAAQVLQPSSFFQINAPVGVRWLYYQKPANVFVGSLSLNTGFYTLTGEAVSVLAKRTLAANTGFYSLTGEANSLIASRKLSLNTGFYTLTGEATSDLATRTLALNTGFYSLTGEANTLTVTRLAVAGGISFALQPSDFFSVSAPVNVRWLYYQAPANIFTTSLSLNTGFYVLTGKAVALTAARTLSAATGFYSLTGETNSLTVSRLALAVSFALQPSSFFSINAPINVRGYYYQKPANIFTTSLRLNTGFYTLTGEAVSTTAARTLPLATGFYTLTGEANSITVGRQPYAVSFTLRPSSFFQITAPINVRPIYWHQARANVYGATLAVDTGYYALTGQPVTLQATGAFTLALDTGFYSLTGEATTLTATHLMPAGQVVRAPPLFPISAPLQVRSYYYQKPANVFYGTLSLNTGFYVLTGEATSLLAKRTLLGATGFYTLTGEANSLTATRTMLAATGFYSLTGEAVTLSTTHVGFTTPQIQIIRPQPGFNISAPVIARFLYWHKPAVAFHAALGLDTGFYVITGEPTTPAATMPAATGFYTVTGEAVTVLAKRTASESTGFYNLTGEAITALAKRSAALATGYYSLAGQAANFGIGMGANTGTYALTGESVGMQTIRRAAAATGYYTLTGEAATLVFSGQPLFTPPQPGLIGIEQPTTLLGGAYPDSLTGTQQTPPSSLNAGIDQPSLIGTDTTPQP